MKEDIMLAMPVNQLTCMVFTIVMEEPMTITIPPFDIEEFTAELSYVIGEAETAESLAELAETCPLFEKYVGFVEEADPHNQGERFVVPKIINGVYIDELGRVKILASDDIPFIDQWPLPKAIF